MSAPVADLIAPEALDRLHPTAITEPAEILTRLRRWCSQQTTMWRGTDRAVRLEEAHIAVVGDGAMELSCRYLDGAWTHLFLNLVDQGVPYFFATQVRSVDDRNSQARRLSVSIPGVVYRAERRDRERKPARAPGEWVKIELQGGSSLKASILDRSPDGLGLLLADGEPPSTGQLVQIHGLQSEAGTWAEVRTAGSQPAASDSTRLGLRLMPSKPSSSPLRRYGPERLEALGGVAAAASPGHLSPLPRVVDFDNEHGEPLRGLLDTTGSAPGVAILIPPAWGKTKETLAPLAASLLETFAAAGQPVSVLRFDGIRKRGESHNDPECREPGLENLNYSFEQASGDVLAAARFMEAEGHGAGRQIVVSFSLASVEARRAIVRDKQALIGAWVSVVGATDPQSLIRVISGGIDYMGGVERGLRFGRQDVQGLLLDMDRASREAIDSRIAFAEDARRDFAAIDIPITWIFGTHDAWMDPERAADCLSFGDSSRRVMLEVLTGHQLKSSREAAEVFGLIASECGRHAIGRAVRPVAPDSSQLRARQREERRRIREARPDLRGFWRDYLVGRDGGLGMQIVTQTRDHRELMARQAEALAVSDEHWVVDLGAGVSPLPEVLLQRGVSAARIISIDYVPEALVRARRFASGTVDSLVANLDLRKGTPALIPLATGSVDRVLASLLINYLETPEVLFAEVRRILCPGGCLVLSALRKDADTSNICVSSVTELQGGRGLEAFGIEGERQMNEALGAFINEAGRLLDYEERGIFRFWDADELAASVEAAGYESVDVEPAFGKPPQAWLVTASTHG